MNTRRLARPLFAVVFATLSFLIVFTAIRYRKYQARLIEDEARTTLQSVNDNKAEQLVRWQQERLADAAVLSRAMQFFEPLRRVAAGTASPRDRAAVLDWLESLIASKRYVNAIITTAAGESLLAVGEYLPRSEHYRALAIHALANGQPLMTTLHNDGGLPRLHAGLTIPIPGTRGRSTTALLLAVDPAKELYPIISWWPRTRKSAETVLIAREGSEVVYLSPSRHAGIELARQRVSVDEQHRSVVRAAAVGNGAADGIDYRQQAVIAMARKLPISNWTLETKIDRAEVKSSVAASDRLLAFMALLLILLSGVALGILWRFVSGLIEEPFRKTQAMLETIIQASPAAMVALNEESLVTLWNPAAERLFGWLEKEVQGRPLPDGLGALPGCRNAQHIAVTGKDGQPVSVSVSSAPLQDGRGRREGSLTVCIDVTDQRRAEASLRQSERDFRELVEGAPIGILIETEYNVRYLNRTALELLGGTDLALVAGAPVIEWVHPDYRDLARQRLERLHQEGTPAEGAELRYLRLDGTAFWVNARSISYTCQDRPGSIVFFTDLTAEKAAQREKSELEEKYRQAQKLESIGRLAGSIAHDFNNHLTVINGYSRLLAEDHSIAPDVRQMLGQVLEAGVRATQLTRQLLAFSRKQLIEFKTLNVNDAIRASEKMFRTLIGEDVRFDLLLEPDLEPILADHGQLNQVLMNLLVNARDAMPEGGRLTVETANVRIEPSFTTTRPELKPGPHVLLSVTDSGCGMDQETLAHAFEPFYTTKQEAGTGLGLATVFGIVHQMNGAIDLESAPGEGTSFKLYFPATEQSAAEPAALEQRAAPSRASELVLLAEDSEQLRRFTASVLASAGYRVLEAASGTEALEVYRRTHPDQRIQLIITDVIMPEMNGKQLAEALWQSDDRLPVLFTSGYTASKLANVDLSDTRASYLPKPFTANDLLRRVREALDAHHRSRLLVVDDDAAVRRFLRTLLEAHGYDVREAGDGEQAIAEVEHWAVDVVITDLVMPAKEGVETITRIRKQWPAVKLMAISGAFNGQLLHVAKLLGAERALLKPVQPEELVAAIREVLGTSAPGPVRSSPPISAIG